MQMNIDTSALTSGNAYEDRKEEEKEYHQRFPRAVNNGKGI